MEVAICVSADCVARPADSCAGWLREGVTSDASYEAAGVEDACGVELLFDGAHELDGGGRIAPGVDRVREQAAAKDDGAAAVGAQARAKIVGESRGFPVWRRRRR